MSIIRGVKDRRFKFVQLLNSMFEDPKLSLKAKGFIGYCLTKKEDWDFHISHLCSVLKEGEDAIYSTVKECIDNGYAYRYRTRDERGHLTEVEYLISDSKEEVIALKNQLDSSNEYNKLLPRRENPEVDQPRRENPGVDSPGKNGGPIYSNTDSSNTREQQQQQNAAVSSKFEHLKKQQAEYNKAKQSYEKPVQPEKPRFYGCLADVDIPESDKLEITSRFDEPVVKNAIAWATHPETKINKGLAPAIKWACVEKPQPPRNPNDELEANKEFAKPLDGLKQGSYTINVLSKCVELDYGTAYKEPFILEFTAKGFREQLNSALRKANFNLPLRTA